MRPKKIKPHSILIGFVLALLPIMWATYVPFPNSLTVLDNEYPCGDVPAIAEAGGGFRLFTEVQRVWVDGREVEAGEGFVRLPENFGPGWYDLTLQIDGENYQREEALYIPPQTSDDFTFVYVTDVHVPPVGTKGSRLIQERKRVFELINAMGPAFVFDTGDMTDYGLEEEYSMYEYLTEGLRMPLYTIPGNHEVYSDPNLERYTQRLGPGNYFFYFGDVLFVAISPLHAYRGSGGLIEGQIRWLDKTLSKEAELKLVFNHIPTAYHMGREYGWVPWFRKDGYYTQIEQGHDRMMEIFEHEKIVNLFGHWHVYTEKFERGGAVFYHTPSITRNSRVKEGPRFRLFRIKNNEILFDRVIEFEKLDIKHERVGDNVIVRITNDEEFAIPITLRLDVPRQRYDSTLGKILGPSKGTLWVKIEAPAKSIRELTVYPSD